MRYEESTKANGETRDEDISRLLVSVSCLSYNHGAYLREALDSFLAQEGDFDIEILIHDDASTDDSADIIREYEARYPGVLRPVYQSENQYSGGIHNISGVYNFPRARGQYIAMCEGDDRWTDTHKIAKQLEFMKAHGDYSLTCHAASIVYEGRAYKSLSAVRPYEGTREISPAEVISKKTNIPTASLFFRRECVDTLPDWYYDCPVGDIPLQLWLIRQGKCYYMDEEMSAYRLDRPGSWGESMDSRGQDCWEEHFLAMTRLYHAFDAETGGAYSEAADEALRRLRFQIDLKEGRAESVLDPSNALFAGELTPSELRLQRLRARAPRLYALMQKAYHTVWTAERSS